MKIKGRLRYNLEMILGRRSIKSRLEDQVRESLEGFFETLIAVADKNPDTQELDLHRLSVAEAEREIDFFLDRQVMAGEKVVRITHGYGKGILACEVPKFLRTHPQVHYLKVGARSGSAVYAVLHQI